MDKDFYKYIKVNGPAAFDKMAKELADELNKAREKYEKEIADQKKKEADLKATAEAAAKKRELATSNLRDALLAYYDTKLTKAMATDCAVAVLEATDELVGKNPGPKVEILKNEKTPNGYEFAAKIHDCCDLYDWDKLFSDWLK